MSPKTTFPIVTLMIAFVIAACQSATPPQPTATAVAPTVAPSQTPVPTATPLPPTPTPNPPTATPTLAPTLAPTPAPLFSDTFDSDRQGWAGTDAYSIREIPDGQLAVELKGDHQLVMLPMPGNLSPDVDLTFDVTVAEGTEGAIAGAMCRARNTGDYYWFEIASAPLGGGFSVYKSIAGKETELIAPTLSAAIRKAGQANSVRLICSGTQMQFSVNDTVVADLTDADIAAGSIVLFTLGTPGSHLMFDNLQVVLPEGVEPVSVAPESPAAFNPGDTILETDFASLDGWSPLAFSFDDFKRTDNFTLESQTDNLYVEVPETFTSVYALQTGYFGQSDVQIDVDVETIAGPNRNNISVVCRNTPQGWYEFGMHSGGLWSIYKYEYANGFTMLADGASTAIQLQKAKNHLTVVCQDDQLSFYINDVKVASAKDAQFIDGSAGVSVTTFNISGAGATFENLTVTVPDPANPPGGAVAPPVSSSGASDSSSPSGSQSGDLNGLWEGTTSQGSLITLNVAGNTVQSVFVMFSIPGCNLGGLVRPISASISGNTFSATDPDIDISGTFNANGSASGTIVIHPQPGPFITCPNSITLTWNAGK